MRIIFLAAALFLSGCASSFFSGKNHEPLPEKFYATITTKDGYGSSINLGEGYFLSCSHVIRNNAGKFDKKICLKEEFKTGPEIDSSATIVAADTINDLVLLRSSKLIDKINVKFVHDPVLERVYWVQPAFYSDGDLFFLVSGRISGFNLGNVFLDKPVFDGASGTGIFDEDGNLVGMAQSTFIYSKNLLFGSLASPKKIEVFLIKNGIKIPKM
ncbi:MAG: serine protease [Patescibacteria group bacterium]|nr:serine protease [Patescibacteria group bacterium]